jgi:hypothetical protein
MSLTPTADRVISVAKSQVGYHEGRDPNGNWNNIQKYSPAVPGLEWSQGQAWCATFVSWVAMKAGVAHLFPRTASTDAGASWYQARGQWSEYPAIGAQGFLARGSDEFHTFIVARYDDTYIYTIEGNTNDNGSPQGDGVYALKRRRRDAVVEGYGYPAYPEGIISADPEWADHRPDPAEPVPAPKPPAHKATARTASFKVATNNIMALPKNPHVKATLQATPAASVIAVQEANPDAFKRVIRNLPGYDHSPLHIGHSGYAAFILFKPNVWRAISLRYYKQYDGVAHISLTRHICVAVLQHRGTGKNFAFLSYHAVTAGKDRNRVRMRAEGLKKVRAILRELKASGIPIIVCGDFNQRGNILSSAAIHTAHRIDHQFAWHGKNVTLARKGSHAVNTASDHDALVVNYRATVK